MKLDLRVKLINFLSTFREYAKEILVLTVDEEDETKSIYNTLNITVNKYLEKFTIYPMKAPVNLKDVTSKLDLESKSGSFM